MIDYRPDKHQVAQSFSGAASLYDDVAVIQRQTADELLERLDYMTVNPKTVLDLGAGTGRNLSKLHKRFPQSELIAMDLAPAMLQQAIKRYRQDQGWKRLWTRQAPVYIQGDAEAIPLSDNSVDLIYANLSLQWCEPRKTFSEVMRVLKPGGVVMYSSLGPDTLKELRQAWAEVDDYPHVNLFYDMHDVGEAMMAAGLTDCVLDVEPYQLHYPSALKMMRDLKQLGAHNVNEGRRKGLTGKALLQKVCDAYEQQRVEAGVPASYEVIYGQGWKQPQQGQFTHADGSVHIPLSEIVKR
jgi:malonyl-CoA O-methyltransferase